MDNKEEMFQYSVNYRVFHMAARLPAATYSVELDGAAMIFAELYSPSLKPYDDTLYDNICEIINGDSAIITYGLNKSKNDIMRELVLAVKREDKVTIAVLSYPHLEIAANMLDVYADLLRERLIVLLDVEYLADSEKQISGLINFIKQANRLSIKYLLMNRYNKPLDTITVMSKIEDVELPDSVIDLDKIFDIEFVEEDK